MSDHSDKFTNVINQALDEQTDQLSPEVMHSLQAARQKALLELDTATATTYAKETAEPSLWQQWLAGLKADPKPTYAFASFASIALVAVLAVNSLTSDTTKFGSDSALAMLDEELSEDVDMLEDLEFALWLAENGETL